jgi:endonuclease
MANTCREAVEEAFANESGVLETSQVIDRIYARYPDRPWKPNAISAHLIGLSVNHTSSVHHPHLRRHGFLFSLGNGRYRKWNPAQDGKWDVINGRVQLVDSSAEPEVAEETEGLETVAVDTSLSLERDLERSLLATLSQLEPNLHLYQTQDTIGHQLDTGTVGRLDILAVDQSENLVVIELKAGRADDRVCGQILRYMGWVKNTLAGNRHVRGIIVANDFTESLRFAAKAMPDVTLKKYEVRFEFTDV